jgi:hypothetical protein
MHHRILVSILGVAIAVSSLSGCRGGGGGGGGGLPTGNLTVTARVITQDGQGIPNAAVWISGHGPFRTGGDVPTPCSRL